MGWCYQSRDPLRRLNPMRQLPLYRTVESVFGPSPRVRAEVELRIAMNALAAEQAGTPRNAGRSARRTGAR